MLVTAVALALGSAAAAAGAVAAAPSVRRLIAHRLLACRSALVIGLVVIGLALPWLSAGTASIAVGALAGVALWTTRPLRRRERHALPYCAEWDWDRFEAGFRTHVARVERQRRGGSEAP